MPELTRINNIFRAEFCAPGVISSTQVCCGSGFMPDNTRANLEVFGHSNLEARIVAKTQSCLCGRLQSIQETAHLWFVKPDVGKPEANTRTCGRLWCAHAFEELSCDGVSVKVCDLWCDMNEQHFRRGILRAGVISSIQVCWGREFMPDLT